MAHRGHKRVVKRRDRRPPNVPNSPFKLAVVAAVEQHHPRPAELAQVACALIMWSFQQLGPEDKRDLAETRRVYEELDDMIGTLDAESLH